MKHIICVVLSFIFLGSMYAENMPQMVHKSSWDNWGAEWRTTHSQPDGVDWWEDKEEFYIEVRGDYRVEALVELTGEEQIVAAEEVPVVYVYKIGYTTQNLFEIPMDREVRRYKSNFFSGKDSSIVSLQPGDRVGLYVIYPYDSKQTREFTISRVSN